NGYPRKGQNQSQNDKTKHENGKSVKEKSNQSQKSKKSKSTKVNPDKVKGGADIEELLNGPTLKLLCVGGLHHCLLFTHLPHQRSSLDSSFERSLDLSSPFVGPSRKRCRSPTTLVPSSTPVPRLIAHALADLLPCKRFKDSYSSEASGEEHMEIGTTDAEIIADLGISDGVGAHTEDGIYMGVEVATSDIRDEEEFEVEANEGDTREVAVDPLDNGGISEPTGGMLLILRLVASRERAGLVDRVRSLGWENLRVRALLCIKRDRVNNLRHHMALSKEDFCQIHRDHDDTQRRLRRLESFVERRLVFRR
ncbi:hypothetical protein Tco_1242579, partial [Tanacetum coccineum]